MKIDIVTVATKSIQQYATYSIALNADYAVRHGYGFHVFTTPNEERHPTWGKVEAAKLLLPLCDWLFVIDADAVVVDVEKTLEEFTKRRGDLLICENGPNGGRPLNGGAILLRNTAAMHRFLDAWYDTGAKYAFKRFHEQEALNDLYESGQDLAITIVPLPFDTFNSHWLDHEGPEWQRRFVLHVMQQPDDVRAQVFARLHAMRNGSPQDMDRRYRLVLQD